MFFLFLMYSLAFSENNVVELKGYQNSCRSLLKTRVLFENIDSAREIYILSLRQDPPRHSRASVFFNDVTSSDYIFVYQGNTSPTFGSSGAERWSRLDSLYLDFREDVYFLKRENIDGVSKFTEFTRFSLSDQALAFAVMMRFFKVITRTNTQAFASDFISLFTSKDLKQQLRSMLMSWDTDGLMIKNSHFVDEAIQLINNPDFKPDYPRSVRKYYNLIIELFEKEFSLISGYRYQYELLLDELERKRLLQYLWI